MSGYGESGRGGGGGRGGGRGQKGGRGYDPGHGYEGRWAFGLARIGAVRSFGS